jgi:hypothetical protein
VLEKNRREFFAVFIALSSYSEPVLDGVSLHRNAPVTCREQLDQGDSKRE